MMASTLSVFNIDIRTDFSFALYKINHLIFVLLNFRYFTADNIFCQPVPTPLHVLMTDLIKYYTY